MMIKNSKQLAVFCQHMVLEDREVFAIIPMHTDLTTNVKEPVVLFTGGLAECTVDLRHMFRHILVYYPRCTRFFTVHNHPSGNPTVSMQDRLLSDTITAASKLIGLELVDSLVVAERGWNTTTGEHGTW